MEIQAPIDVVWSVLADPRQYTRFVVGNKRIRSFDPAWPEMGSEIHHTVGLGPAMLRDHSRVIGVEAPTLLRLWAGLRPVGVADTTFRLEAVGPGRTAVTVEEHFTEGPARKVWSPALDAMLALRNAELLRRLRQIATHRAATTARAEGPRQTSPPG